jgi:hypothetical protein
MSNIRILVPYEECKSKILEGDILLFRGAGTASRFIRRASKGIYTHVGAASWANGPTNPEPILECVEFREGVGGRTVYFENELRKHNGTIDVYRTTPYYNKFFYDPEKKSVESVLQTFDGKAVTRVMRKMTGLPYGWRRIWWMAKHDIPCLRWFYQIEDLMDDKLNAVVYPVCSTAIAHAWNTINFDLIPNQSDSWSSPSDISRSCLLSYVFTPILKD